MKMIWSPHKVHDIPINIAVHLVFNHQLFSTRIDVVCKQSDRVTRPKAKKLLAAPHECDGFEQGFSRFKEVLCKTIFL